MHSTGECASPSAASMAGGHANQSAAWTHRWVLGPQPSRVSVGAGALPLLTTCHPSSGGVAVSEVCESVWHAEQRNGGFGADRWQGHSDGLPWVSHWHEAAAAVGNTPHGVLAGDARRPRGTTSGACSNYACVTTQAAKQRVRERAMAAHGSTWYGDATAHMHSHAANPNSLMAPRWFRCPPHCTKKHK